MPRARMIALLVAGLSLIAAGCAGPGRRGGPGVGDRRASLFRPADPIARLRPEPAADPMGAALANNGPYDPGSYTRVPAPADRSAPAGRSPLRVGGGGLEVADGGGSGADTRARDLAIADNRGERRGLFFGARSREGDGGSPLERTRPDFAIGEGRIGRGIRGLIARINRPADSPRGAVIGAPYGDPAQAADPSTPPADAPLMAGRPRPEPEARPAPAAGPADADPFPTLPPLGGGNEPGALAIGPAEPPPPAAAAPTSARAPSAAALDRDSDDELGPLLPIGLALETFAAPSAPPSPAVPSDPSARLASTGSASESPSDSPPSSTPEPSPSTGTAPIESWSTGAVSVSSGPDGDDDAGPPVSPFELSRPRPRLLGHPHAIRRLLGLGSPPSSDSNADRDARGVRFWGRDDHDWLMD